ncbi:hypothetical protein BD626DRAFT_488040 [Schizophyllum amplum]|uniref:Glycopeptide n=1 Tax=Schizophyllum amplum TaxID=97359 RepID=A0A550CKA5_9AGAR|nr:hypothetical protein BD626DRAFT_488040 [Auriculariopsis ampla]
MQFTKALVAVVAVAATLIAAEQHVVQFVNNCGTGTPKLYGQNGALLHSGSGSYTRGSALIGGIAYLQTGPCGANGENCPLVEMTLRNPPSPGAGSSTDISLIPPHKYTKSVQFAYYNGCDGQGKTCKSASCSTAFHTPTDYGAQVQCQTNNVNLRITFCPA